MHSSDWADSALRIGVWSVLYALAGAVALLPIVDQDIWWHLRTGEWIVEHGTVPTTDPFSRYGLEHHVSWQAYSWLFEVLAYGLYRLGGFPALFIGRCAMTLAIVAALHRLLAKRLPFGRDAFLLSAVVLALSVLALLPLVKERPWLFTILFSALTLDVVLDERAGWRTRRLWLLPLLFALWANLHIQFVHGLLLLGLASVAGKQVRRLGLATVLCAAATLVTPYHIHLYAVVREYASQRVPLQQVAEMQAMGFRSAWDWCALILAGVAVFALGRRATLSAFDVLLLLAGAWFGFRSCRDVWLLVLASLAVIAPAPPPTNGTTFQPRPWQAAVIAVVVLPLLVWVRVTTSGGFEPTLEAMYPVRAVEEVRRQRLTGPLFNSYAWGGYLIWELREMPVSLDGRANLYGDARLARAFATWAGKPGWDKDPDLKSAQLVIAEKSEPLTALLRLDRGFRVAHEDDTAVVFVRIKGGE